MGNDVLNPRRTPRVRVQYSVELRHRFSSWTGQTEDLGPAGCQIVTPLLLSRGRELRVNVRALELGRVVKLQGHVVWTRPEARARIGVAFAPTRHGDTWFDELLAATPAAARSVARTPERLSGSARLHLGEPPHHPEDFTADEHAVLRAAAGGLTVDAFARALGSPFDRTRGALFSLLGRRFVVLDFSSSVAPHRWRNVIGDVARAWNDRGERGPQQGGRAYSAQRLYDEGIAHLDAGRLKLAVQLFREALENEPADDGFSVVRLDVNDERESAARRLGPAVG